MGWGDHKHYLHVNGVVGYGAGGGGGLIEGAPTKEEMRLQTNALGWVHLASLTASCIFARPGEDTLARQPPSIRREERTNVIFYRCLIVWGSILSSPIQNQMRNGISQTQPHSRPPPLVPRRRLPTIRETEKIKVGLPKYACMQNRAAEASFKDKLLIFGLSA